MLRNEAFEERAAIHEYDAGMPRDEAEAMAQEEGKAMDNRQTLTKQQFDALQAIKKNNGILMNSQEKTIKILIRQLIAKNLAQIDSKGWVTANDITG
jgi:hypothetical protein